MDWQTPAAVLVVAITTLAFVFRLVRRHRDGRSSCGGDCGCPFKPH